MPPDPQLPSTQNYTVGEYFNRASIRTLDHAKPSTFDGDIVQTSLLGRDVYTTISVTNDVNPRAETDSSYLKTPIAHFSRFGLKPGRAGNKDGGGDSEREGGRRRQ